MQKKFYKRTTFCRQKLVNNFKTSNQIVDLIEPDILHVSRTFATICITQGDGNSISITKIIKKKKKFIVKYFSVRILYAFK